MVRGRTSDIPPLMVFFFHVDNMFHFTTFNVEDPHDPSVGLINGELAIPGNLLRREVFDPVISQVLDLIEEQTRKVDQRIDALLLVGGFSGSEYLFRRVEVSIHNVRQCGYKSTSVCFRNNLEEE